MSFIFILILITVLIFIIGILIAGTAHSRFNKTCNRYANIPNSLDMNGHQFLNWALYVLNYKTQVYYHADEKIGDCYHPKTDTIVLNKKTFFNKSIVNIAIASHEMGHAIQKNKSSVLLFLTSVFQFLNSLLGGLFLPLIIIGLVVNFIPFDYSFTGEIFIIIGLISFTVGLILKLLLIPLEYNASYRAQKFLKETQALTKNEVRIIKKIHKRALLTYIAYLFENPYRFFIKIFKGNY